jgi:hypothetical protein
MQTLLERAARWQKDRLDSQTAVDVIVRDGSEATDGIKAIPGQSDFLQYALDEHTGTAKTFDWAVAANELLFAGQKREPQDGWEIWHELEDGRTAVYLVIAASGTRCFDVMDHLGVLFRIHTKLDRIEPAA